jgi:hypothetical protein
VVLDQDIYPRSEWSQATVDRYAEALAAGDSFPPIALEAGTSRLLDGMHRYRSHRQAGREEIAAEYHEIPAGVPPKLYAASLSTRHGDRVSGKDLMAIAREIVQVNPDYSIQTVAKYCSVTRQTVSKWVSDITDRRVLLRRVRALLLTRLGWSQRRVGDFLGADHKTVGSDVNSDISPHLSEDVILEALTALPDECVAIAEEIREERIFASWSDDERLLLKRLRDGETIVISQRDHHSNLAAWANSAGLVERVDRRSDWGNPFEMPGDGDREQVIASYRDHYLPYKPSLLRRVDELAGKALACWCAPAACHADILASLVSGSCDSAHLLAALHEIDDPDHIECGGRCS